MSRKKIVFDEQWWEDGFQYGCHFDGNVLTGEKQEEEQSMAKGVYLSPLLDSQEAETLWGRMKVGLHYEGDSYITISYGAFPSKTVYVDHQEWYLPDLIEDLDMNITEKLLILDRLWVEEKKNTSDLLLSSVKGRYFCFKIELVSYEGISPTVSALTIEYPMDSITNYLPSFYRENKTNFDFIVRFLGIFQSEIYDLQDTIDEVSKYFDPDYVTGDFLSWLAEWVSADMPMTWSEEKRRSFIKVSVQLYQKKGTIQGMEELVEFCTGKKPIIIETWEVMEKIQKDIYEEAYQLLYGNDIYSFFVLLDDRCFKEKEDLQELQYMTEKYKPAHTRIHVVPLKQCIVLGKYTYLGVNTQLMKHSSFQVDDTCALPFRTIL